MQKILYLARLVVWPSVIQFLTQSLNMNHSFQVKNLIVIVQRPVKLDLTVFCRLCIHRFWRFKSVNCSPGKLISLAENDGKSFYKLYKKLSTNSKLCSQTVLK